MDMDPGSISDRQPEPAFPGAIQLLTCPQCEYRLEGLPSAHRCPECGFEYDDRTFVLTGISRGTSSLQPSRKWLWVLLALTGWMGSNFLVVLIAPGAMTFPILAAVVVWGGLAAYLMLTGKGERRGIERFLFAAGGFGYVADLTAQGATGARVLSWREVDTVLVDRKGSQWYRLRIGQGSKALGDLHRTLLDVGIRCNAETAEWIEQTLYARISAARWVP